MAKIGEQTLWRAVLWLEAAVAAAVILSFYLYYADWESTGGYNLALAAVAVGCLVAGLVLHWTSKTRRERTAVLSFLTFLAGCTTFSYAVLLYQYDGAESSGFAIFLVLGAALTLVGVGAMVASARRVSRLNGFYSLWLFSILLTLFMPLHEYSSALAYSGRDEAMGLLGLGLSLVSSLFIVLELRSQLSHDAWVTVGDAKYISGKFDEAVEHYDRYLRTEPKSASVHASKGAALLGLGMWAEAIESFDLALGAEPSNLSAVNGKGLALAHLKRYSEALDYHDRAIKGGGVAVGWNNRGNTLNWMGAAPEESLSCYVKALEANSAYDIAWYNKGKVEAKLGRNAEAAASFRKACELRPRFAEAWFQLGRAQAALGARDEAVFSYDMAIQLRPANIEAWSERKVLLVSSARSKLRPMPVVNVPSAGTIFGPALAGAASFDVPSEEVRVPADADAAKLNKAAMAIASRGEIARAVEMLDLSIAKFPRETVTHVSKGILLSRMGKVDEALAAFDRATKLSPEWVGTWFVMGMVLATSGEYDRALACFDHAIRLRPGYVDAWSVKGIVLGTLKRYDDAASAFAKIIELDPENEEAWRSRGTALNKLGRYEEAMECFAALTKLRPGLEETEGLYQVELRKLEDATALLNLGIALAKAQEYGPALEQLDSALSLRPSHVDALYISGVVRGVVTDYAGSLAQFEKVLSLRPTHLEALYGKGNILVKLDRDSEAIPVLDKVLSLDSTHHDAWCDRGHALCKMDKMREAVESFDRALALNPKLQKAITLREACVRGVKACKMDEPA